MMHKVHAVLPPGDSEDIIKRLLGQMQTDSSSESKKPESLPVTAAKSKDACDQVQAWIRTNDSKDISAQPAFARFKTKLKNELCKCSLTKREPKCPMHGLDSSLYSTVTLGDIMYHTADAIFESIPAYVPTVAMGLSMIHEDAKGRLDLGEDSCHYPPTCSFLLMKAKEEPDGKMIDVPNAEALDVLLSIRGAYLREGLQDVLEMIRNIDECYFDALTDVKKLPEVLRGLRGRGSGVLALVEGKLCMTGADATVWGSIWQTILHTLGATGMLPALSDLFSDEIEEPFRVKEEADEDGKAVDVDAVESVPSKSRTRDEDDDPADEPNSKRRLVGFMEKARASGEIDMTEMTVTMKSVYTFSEAGLVEPIHIVDLMNVKKELEFFLMKRAMSEWGSALEHVTLNYAKSMVMCKRRSPFEDSSKHRIYVFGQISMEASNKTIKVASLKHVNGPCGISFYCGPNGYDRMTSQVPCAAWLMKVVGSHDDDSDDEASTSTMVKSTEKATLKVASLFDPEKTFELELELPYLHARPLDEWQKKKEMAKAKKRKTGAEDSMVQITRPPFLSRKSLQAAAKGDNMVYTFGGKTAEEIFKDPAKIKPTTKNNRELLADRGNTGKEVSHLMN
ncbi:unnamed protein product [Cladocopium goreaui]|uniref:Uncharacterized protein n=1 Tax=Cladocopium goreaui TaxID=2562237 RepID=A0A9P1FUB2_9DINO|nr:unnamed protein product [Cladocopium goreaui]